MESQENSNTRLLQHLLDRSLQFACIFWKWSDRMVKLPFQASVRYIDFIKITNDNNYIPKLKLPVFLGRKVHRLQWNSLLQKIDQSHSVDTWILSSVGPKLYDKRVSFTHSNWQEISESTKVSFMTLPFSFRPIMALPKLIAWKLGSLIRFVPLATQTKNAK